LAGRFREENKMPFKETKTITQLYKKTYIVNIGTRPLYVKRAD